VLRLQRDGPLLATYRANCRAAAGRYDRAALAMEMLGVLEDVANSWRMK
jgi:hypothetical protein